MKLLQLHKLLFSFIIMGMFITFVFPFFDVKVYGQTFVVNTFLDGDNHGIDINLGDGICQTLSGTCSLRAAINESNALPGADTIQLQTGTYVLDNETILDDVGGLEIFDDLTITGQGSSNTRIDLQTVNNYNIISLEPTNPVTINISGLTLTSTSSRCVYGATSTDLVDTTVLTADDILVENCDYGLYLYNISNGNITDSTFRQNTFQGVRMIDSNMNFENSTFTDNDAEGIKIDAFDESKIVRIENSNVVNNGNPSNFGGGVVFEADCAINTSAPRLYVTKTNISNNIASFGGGILATCGHLILDGSTIAENNVNLGNGGGLNISYTSSRGGLSNPTAFTEIKNTTISGNLAGSGGAIYVNSVRIPSTSASFSLDLINNTIANNSSGIGFINGAGGVNNNPITARFLNNLITSNNNLNCEIDQDVIISGSNNLSSDSTCSNIPNFTQNSTLPTYLGPLQNNGGRTRTHALLFGSQAINNGTNLLCPNIDQRELARPSGGLCDVGSFEYIQATQLGSFQGTIFFDTNRNGVFDTGDRLLSNIEIEILDANNNIVTTVLTNANGIFSGTLPIGRYSYRVKESSLTNGLNNRFISIGIPFGSFDISNNLTTEISIIGYSNSGMPNLIRTGGV